MACHPRHSDDRLCGLSSVIFFGMCLWVFVEQIIQGAQAVSRAAGRRAIAVLGLAGGSLGYAGIAEADAPMVYRAGVTAGGVVLAAVAAWAAWRLLRARLARRV